MQCCKLYLSNLNNEFKAPMDNITKNNLKAQIGDNCIEWAEDYFCEEENYNKNIQKQELYKSYCDYVGNKSAIGVRKFKKAIERFCELKSYVFNPENMCDSSGRIMVNLAIPGSQKRIKKECFYIANGQDITGQLKISTDGVEF